MTRWFSVIQLGTESDEEGRFERVVDGVHEANKGLLYIILVVAGAAMAVAVFGLLIIRFSTLG
jgi:hypothetical protein